MGEAEDAVCARIPTDDRAVGIEHDDRVVGDALDQQAKSFFAFAEESVGVAEFAGSFVDSGFELVVGFLYGGLGAGGM